MGIFINIIIIFSLTLLNQRCSNIVKVIIPSTVKFIGISLIFYHVLKFYNQHYLIGPYAFFNLPILAEVSIGTAVDTNNPSLLESNTRTNAITISPYAFYGNIYAIFILS